MTQTSEKGYFVQYPHLLISGRTDLTRDDRWLLLALMQDHRCETPFYLTFREIESISGIPLSLLSSYTNKTTDIKREGCMERVARVTGYITYTTEREIGKNGKPKGNKKLCITIHYSKIWQDNKPYSDERVPNPVSYANKPGLYDKPVSYANKIEVKPVRNDGSPVSHADSPVSTANDLVSHVNTSVSHANMLDPVTQLAEPVDDPSKDNKDINLDIKEKKGESESPGSSPPTALSSSFVSDISFSKDTPDPLPGPPQGGITSPPASVKGVSLSAGSDTLNLATSGGVSLTDLLIVEQTGVTALDAQNDTPDAQGYMNPPDTAAEGCVSEPPDSDALSPIVQQGVVQNGIVTQEILLGWLQALEREELQDGKKLFALGRAEKRQESMEKLMPLIASMDDLRGIYRAARGIYDGIIYLSNLVNLRVIAAWIKPGLEVAYVPSSEGMTLSERDELVTGALAYCPDFAVNGAEENGRYFVAIFESEASIIELGSLDDWPRVPQERLDRAAEYGARYWNAELAVAI